MRTRSLFSGIGAAVASVMVLVLVLGWLDQARPASDSAFPLPAVGVSVDNARTSARTGDVLTYRTQVRNHEPTTQRFVVTQLLPGALDVVATTPAGRADSRQVAWDIRLRPGETVQVELTGRVTEPRSGFAQLTTTSCLGVAENPRLACATDTDALVVPNHASFGRLLLALGVVAAIVGLLLGILALATGAFRARDDRRPRSVRRHVPALRRDSARWVGATRTAVGPVGLLLVTALARPGSATGEHRDHRRARGPPQAPG